MKEDNFPDDITISQELEAVLRGSQGMTEVADELLEVVEEFAGQDASEIDISDVEKTEEIAEKFSDSVEAFHKNLLLLLTSVKEYDQQKRHVN